MLLKKIRPRASNPLLNGSAVATAEEIYDIYGVKRGTKPDIGAVEFTPKKIDAGIINIDSPAAFLCSNIQNIKATLLNFGSDALTSVKINWSINGNLKSPYLVQ